MAGVDATHKMAEQQLGSEDSDAEERRKDPRSGDTPDGTKGSEYRSEFLPPSPARIIGWMILTILVVIFTTEVLEDLLRIGSQFYEGVLHILVLTGTLLPIFYFFWYTPLTRQMAKCRNSEEEVRNLSHRLLVAGEEERRNVARELHDVIGQKLTSLQIRIDRLQQSLSAGEVVPPGACNAMIGLVSDLTADLRNVLAGLRPGTIEELGIDAALEGYCGEVSGHQPGLRVHYFSTGTRCPMTREAETALFRACQEALTNVVKHAGASRAEVRLTYSYPGAILTIQDNGVGYEDHRQRGAESGFSGRYGLIGMRERIASVGGNVRIASTPGGTRIRMEVPIA